MTSTAIRKIECQQVVGTSTVIRKVERQQVVGSGGRLRHVWLCEMECWHGSYGQAMRCKWAQAETARLAEEAGQ